MALAGAHLRVTITRAAVRFPLAAGSASSLSCGPPAGAAADLSVAEVARLALSARDPADVAREAAAAGGVVTVRAGGSAPASGPAPTAVALREGVDFFATAGAWLRAGGGSGDAGALREAWAAQVGGVEGADWADAYAAAAAAAAQ